MTVADNTDGAVAAGGTATALAERRTWLERRRCGVGASDVAPIMGRSPWGSAWSVWADKMPWVPVDDDDPAEHLQLGRDLEPVITAWFTRRSGLHVFGAQQMVWHPAEPWFATVDGLVVEAAHDSRIMSVESALGVLESKYDSGAPWDEVPEHYRIQANWAMLCAGLERAWVACMHLPFGRPRFRVYELARDDELLAAATTAVEAFWRDHVLTRMPPPTDTHPATETAIALVARWLDPVPPPEGEAIDDLAAVVDELRAFHDARRRLKRDITAHENLLRARLLQYSEGFVAGQLAASYRPQGRTDIDREALRRDHGDTYDVHSTVRVLRLHTPRAPRRSA